MAGIAAALGTLLLAGGLSFGSGAASDPIHNADPNVIWSIGTTDGSATEFHPGSVESLVYDVSTDPNPSRWYERQDDPKQKYSISFDLSEVSSSPVMLAVRGFFMEGGPSAILVDINGKHGSYRLVPHYAKGVDFRQEGNLMYTRVFTQIPFTPSFLRKGRNVISLSVADEGIFYYDSVTLSKISGFAREEQQPKVEPTIFFRKTGAELAEVTDVIIPHEQPLDDISVSLRVGAALVTKKIAADRQDFGDEVLELDVPAQSAPKPYELILKTSLGEKTFRGEYKPEKRWKLFAGLKIHNDIGYTDLQENAEEVHDRNVDQLLKILPEYPWYKFNLENSWIVNSYAQARSKSQFAKLMRMAALDRVGISGLYLNLLTALCSREELYRALYFAADLHRTFGVPIRSASLTDTPSQSWALPSVLADAGITGFTLASNQHRGPLLMNSDLNEESPFYWEGPDGRRIMAFFARAYGHLGRLSASAGHQGIGEMRRAIGQALTRYRRPDYPMDALYLFGFRTDNAVFGDGGVKVIAAWNGAYEYPKIIAATDTDYFNYIAKHFGSQLRVFRGDAGSFWADAAGSSAAETILNRDSQRLLPQAEMISAWASLFNPAISYPENEFRNAWKEVLFYDEHTWGANASITQPDRTFVTAQFRFKRAHAVRANWVAHDLLTRALNRVVQNIAVDRPLLFVFNPDLHSHTSIVDTELDSDQRLYDVTTGQVLPVDVLSETQPSEAGNSGYRASQRSWRHIRFLAEQVPALGYRAYGVKREGRSPLSANKAIANSWEIDSRYYHLTLDPATGAVARLYDKELNRDLIDNRAPFKLNELIYAAGGAGEQIVTNLFTWAPTQLDVTGQTGARLIENVRTPFGQRIRIEARAKNVPLIESEISIYDRVKRIDITNHIKKDDIRAKEALYFAFPFHVSPPDVQYQVQNSWVRPEQDLLPGANREWFATQNLVLSRDTGVTVAWASPDIPLFTITDINRGRWLKHLDIQNGHIYSYVTNNYWDTNIKASQGGDLVVHYFITSSQRANYDTLARFDTESRAGDIVYPFLRYTDAAKVQETRMPTAEGSFLHIEASNGQLIAFKKAEDGNGYILRLLETGGRNGSARIATPLFRITAAFITNGVEENSASLAIRSSGITIPLQAHRFSTVRLVFARSESTRQPQAPDNEGNQ